MSAQGPFLIEIIFNGNPIVLFYNLSRRQSLGYRARQKKTLFLVQVFLFEHFCGILFLLSNPPPNENEQSYLPGRFTLFLKLQSVCSCE